jgi:hypothetical protein
MVSASSDAVIVAGPGPSSSRVVNVKVSEIEKLTGAARIFSVATAPMSVRVHSTIQRGSSAYERTPPAAAARANAPAAMTAQGYAARIDNLGIDTRGRSDIRPHSVIGSSAANEMVYGRRKKAAGEIDRAAVCECVRLEVGPVSV